MLCSTIIGNCISLVEAGMVFCVFLLEDQKIVKHDLFHSETNLRCIQTEWDRDKDPRPDLCDKPLF